MSLEKDVLDQFELVIPAFNEEEGIGACLAQLLNEYPGINITVIDDGSTDNTHDIVNNISKVNLIKHDYNKGYGAALKTGMRKSDKPIVVWFDSDGQHKSADLPSMVLPIINNQYDAILGARQKGSAFVIKRVPGKFILKIVAQIVARQNIPDLNCGYRAFKRSLILKYLHLLPNGFSASSTSTLIMIKRGYKIKFQPILCEERKGTSSVSIIRDGIRTLKLTWNIFNLFDSMLFFGVCSAIQLIIGLCYSVYTIKMYNEGIPILGAVIIISAMLTFFMGLISSQINHIRLERLE
jgi:glycosyltransferase involved in cell wall biosynthesis